MKALSIVVAAALGLAALLSFRPAQGGKPEVGSVPPEIDAAGWFNHLGPAPSLASLKGQTVLIEFWATWCGPCVAAWPHLQSLHEEYESKGLVILGLSAETPDVVETFVEERGITARVAHGSNTSGKYGVTGIPATFVIGPDGKVAWHGHPSGLSKGILEGALKGAKARTGGMLGVVARTEATGRLASVAQSMEQGKLAKALQAAQAVAGDEKASEGERADASSLVGEIEAHIAALNEAAQKYSDSRDVLRALSVYQAVAKEFGSAQPGAEAKSRIEHLKKDPVLSKELAAAEAFEKTRASVAKLGTSKAREKWKEFADKNKGTRAGERAAALAQPAKS